MDIKLDKDMLTITIPVGKDAVKNAPKSKSEKNKMIATTGGFMAVQGAPGFRLNLHLIGPLD